MITLQDFRAAPFEKKCDVVMADTNFIVARKFGDAKVYLYHTGEFLYRSLLFTQVQKGIDDQCV